MRKFVNYVTKIQSTQRALWVFIRRSGALCAKCPGASGAARYAGETISLKEKQCGGERLHRTKKPPGISQSQGVTACQKSLAEFAARRRQIKCNPFFAAACTSQKTLLIPKPVKKLEKLFIAPKVRQVLYETSQRVLTRCACAQRTGFLIKFFNQESV